MKKKNKLMRGRPQGNNLVKVVHLNLSPVIHLIHLIHLKKDTHHLKKDTLHLIHLKKDSLTNRNHNSVVTRLYDVTPI